MAIKLQDDKKQETYVASFCYVNQKKVTADKESRLTQICREK